MKKIIRLTESDLHNMIAESVNKILNEIDPRTASSAAQKRFAQAKNASNTFDRDRLMKQGHKNMNYALDKFNNDNPSTQFGQEYVLDKADGKDHTNYHAFVRDQEFSTPAAAASPRFANYNDIYFDPENEDNDRYERRRGSSWDREISNEFNTRRPDKFEQRHNLAKQIARPNPEKDYESGKGWKNK